MKILLKVYWKQPLYLHKVPVTLLEYSMNAVTQSIDAIVSTSLNSWRMAIHAFTGETVHRTFSGTGADMDIVISSVRAYVGALNKMMSFRKLLVKNNKPERSAVIYIGTSVLIDLMKLMQLHWSFISCIEVPVATLQNLNPLSNYVLFEHMYYFLWYLHKQPDRSYEYFNWLVVHWTMDTRKLELNLGTPLADSSIARTNYKR
ncbi:uncharacterized protein LOC125873594 [Solanum stenotomum]|uniref:uncharacterized protein LOC125873594 n=1 Tax=Solanum stenotomum TaxID=172797 RepID=UPI0020D19933|nr:uncharacterized protein LOC125873594 [Solanum stenotomum]